MLPLRRRALEQQVLEQVRHAGLAVVLVRRADLVGDVDRGRRLRRVGEQQHRQPVGQPVFGDALDRRSLGDARGQRGMHAGGDEQRDEERRQAAQERCGESHGEASCRD